MEVTEEMIYTFAARFMDQRWAGEVNYNTDYEAHDTNYRMALISKANEMVGDNEIVKALITKEIIAMLSPAEDIPEYESVYIDTIPDSALKALMTLGLSILMVSRNINSLMVYFFKDLTELTAVSKPLTNFGL
jgi:hypothetical protein